MKKLRVLHLASFLGNVGDNANHLGFRHMVGKEIHYKLEFVELEIREFYRKHRFYDEQFVDYVNEFDLFVIGGGNYFELWPTNSPTGTSIGFSVEQMERIKCPILFNALGVDIGQGIGEGSREKFRNFMDYCLANPRVFIAVRNDGAIQNLRELFGESYTQKVFHTPDGGFLLPAQGFKKTRLQTYVGINIVSDMAMVRYSEYGIDSFVRDVRSFILWLSNQGLKTILFPHIPSDLNFISEVLSGIKNDKVLRESVVVAPSEQGDEGLLSLLNYYAQCDQILATRFHSNVLGMVLRIPTIGLNSYPQIEHLYRELELPDQTVKTNTDNFLESLKKKFLQNQDESYRKFLIAKYDQIHHANMSRAQTYCSELNAWLGRCQV